MTGVTYINRTSRDERAHLVRGLMRIPLRSSIRYHVSANVVHSGICWDICDDKGNLRKPGIRFEIKLVNCDVLRREDKPAAPV